MTPFGFTFTVLGAFLIGHLVAYRSRPRLRREAWALLVLLAGALMIIGGLLA